MALCRLLRLTFLTFQALLNLFLDPAPLEWLTDWTVNKKKITYWQINLAIRKLIARTNLAITKKQSGNTAGRPLSYPLSPSYVCTCVVDGREQHGQTQGVLQWKKVLVEVKHIITGSGSLSHAPEWVSYRLAIHFNPGTRPPKVSKDKCPGALKIESTTPAMYECSYAIASYHVWDCS